ncbi:unnamed protein product [Rotaria sordida]|uniref:Tetratricopeptide repeat protein n=3 Tax=Rotaria sordida TaxID=392033 RepID=A0A815ARA2_9BILA|nr:unnamed protein product [Rotaria sordida]CAF4027121.1 unnamed protein product [Rotaria sordida]
MGSKGSGISLIGFDEQEKLPTPIRNATIEPIELFQELSSCISFIEQQTKENKVIILITTTVEENILQTFESLTVIEAILILSTTDINVDTLPSKVVGVYSQTETLLRSLSETLDIIEQQINANSIIFNHHTDGTDNLAFYFYYLWKNHTDEQKSTKESLADQARLIFQSNNQIKSYIQQFETSYKSYEVFSWLDKQRHPFPYHLLISNALRSHNQELLSLSRFFLNDLTKRMKPLLTGSNYKQVYFATKLSINFIDQLEQKIKTDIIAFQCFLPVTSSRTNALTEATRLSRRQKMNNVLFKIDITNNTLCASLGETILIDMATPFQIACVTRSASTTNSQQSLTIIKLIALNKDNRDQLFEQFIQQQKKLGKTINDLLQRLSSDISDDEALADEHMTRSEWSQAANIFAHIINPNVRVLNKYGCLLREHLNNLSDALKCHQQALLKATNREHAETLIYLGLVHKNMKQHDEAFKVYSQALQWFENETKRDPVMIARCLIGLGNAQWGRQQLTEAFDYTERALAIRENEIKPKNDFDIAACLGNMSSILHDQGDIQRALSYATRTVDLLNTCGKDDPRLAAILNNSGAIHMANGDLVKAREYFERALESISNENHPHRKSTLANIARLDTIEKSKQ